jgi:hypothetical protein
MKLERKQDLSIFYWLQGLLAPVSTTIKVVDGFPEEVLTLPTVSIEGENIRVVPHELGNRRGRRERVWTIDVFATNKAQRDELTSVILDDLETGIPVYDYDEGFPPGVSPTQLGLLSPFDIDVLTVHNFGDLVEKLYWRTSIRFISEYSQI